MSSTMLFTSPVLTRVLINLLLIAPCALGLAAEPGTNVLAQYDRLKSPAISKRQNQKMIVVEAKGDPNATGGRAFGLLFQLYYRSPETPKAKLYGFPRARWPGGLEGDKAAWTGFYALPVPDSLSQLPAVAPEGGLKASLTTWEYGEVAEILHVGPYTTEGPTLKRLADFIKEKGYTIQPGGHEEEYVVGPGMNGKGDPEKYLTVLRYRVKKAASQ